MVETTAAEWLSHALGWIYTAAWSLSFYPQVILNYRRKSVSGLSIDFLYLNVLGFACYTVFNALLLFSHTIKEQYKSEHDGHSPSVRLNDLAFSVHAFLLASISLVQSLYYKRDRNQVLSRFNTYLVSILPAVLLLLLLGKVTDVVTLSWLALIYLLSYIKLYISFAKYFPQAFINYKRKSTIGWSIENILLDITGGILSLAQLILDASIHSDWGSIIGNPGKLGLGILSISFDLVFIGQHFVLYRRSTLSLLSNMNGIENAGDEAVEERTPLVQNQDQNSQP